MKTIETMIEFNFGYIKQQAKPGSWRRGYGYFREKQLQKLELTETGVEAKVKGKFKEAYNIRLDFLPDQVHARCDCPLEEEWCKHAVAVALESVEQHLWQRYFNLPIEDETVELETSDFLGHYKFFLRAPGKSKKVGVRIVERGKGKQGKSGKSVTQIEPVLRAAFELQNKEGEGAFNNIEKRELNIMQLLLKNGQTRSNDGWYNLPTSESEELIKLLSQVEEVCTENGKRIIFEQNPLFLLMAVNVSMAGNVLVSLHWIKQEPYDAYPLEEITLFGKDVPWGLYKNHMYPLSNLMSSLPQHLTRSSFTDIRDADGGKFMYEVLPELRKQVDMDLADIVDQVQLKNRPPEKIVTLEMMDEATLKIRANLEFSYDGVKVPFSKKAPETPYVMVIKKDTETIYWVKRDMHEEKAAYQTLVDGGMELMQTNLFFGEGDDAIDFYNVTLPQVQANESDPWMVKLGNNLSSLKGSEDPLQIIATIGFAPQSVDQFILKLECAVGERRMTLDEVQQYLMQGKKYFFLKGLGYVEIPLATILQFGKALQAFDAEELEKDTYQIKTYKVGLLAELVEMGVELKMSKKFQTFWDVITSFKSMEEVEVPKSVQAELRGYQKQGFHWLWFLYSYGLNGILADDMGLGKTLQTLVLLQHARDQDGQMPSLVVCPSSIVFNWVNETHRFTPELKVVNLTGADRHKAYKQIQDADVVVTSYALLRRDIRALENYKFRYVVLDESQNIKNFEAQTTQASKRLQSLHRLALSGTPVENRLTELWSVFDFLMPGFLYDIDDFKYRYVFPIEERANRDAERRLKKQVFPFILRRLKQDVAKDLPPKVEAIKYCNLTDKQQDLYLDWLDKTRDQVFGQIAEKGGVDKASTSIFAALLRLRQICCHPDLMGELNENVHESGKFDALKDMIEEIISEGGRILLYSQFVEMLKLVRKWLEVKGIKYEYLTGETRDRESAVYRFNNDESIPIFLISLKAGGTGLNLTGADYVIHYDPWWNPAAEDQATDRAHRIGQTKTVFVYRLITKGTVEEKIMKLKDRKRDLVDSIIAADRSVGKMLSFEDLKDILSADF